MFPIFWALLTLFSVGYIIASAKWNLNARGVFYEFVYGGCEWIVGMTAFLLLVMIILSGVQEAVKDVRSMRRGYPRFKYAVRAAKSAWRAWDEPAITERRKALERRTLDDERDFERALMEVAHEHAQLD